MLPLLVFIILMIMIFAILVMIQMQTRNINEIYGQLIKVHRVLDEGNDMQIERLETVANLLDDICSQLETFEGWIPEEDFNEARTKGVRRRMERREEQLRAIERMENQLD